MTTISFGEDYQGTQVGINYGSINYQYAQKENKDRDTDRGVLGSLSFPEMLDRRDNIAPCHTNTCRWILDLHDFKNWKIQSRGLLWIKGKPGAGKSTLMAFLYGQLSEERELKRRPGRAGGVRLDFFFSARGTELQHTPLGMLRSLLNQLYDFDETVRPPIRKIFEDRCRQYGYGENHWQWTQVKLEELLADAILESAERREVMVFVDALDEAGAEFAQHVASYFHRLISRAEKMEAALKICISCRHYPIAEDGQAVNIIVEAHNRDDIASYVENAFVGISAEENQEDLKNLTKHLIHQADGVFQWIHLLVPSIKRRIAERESFDEIHSWLREVPAGLKEVYVYIINHVIMEHNRKQSLLLFQWVCLAERPLTVTQTRFALATENIQISLSQTSVPQVSTYPRSLENTRHFVDNDDHTKIRIKALSGGLAEVVSTERGVEVVQVVHQSVNDFLCERGFELLSSHVTANASSLDGGRILPQCQAVLYRLCLISVATFAQLWETMKDSVGQPGVIASDAVQYDTWLCYATTCLFGHAKKAAGSRIGILKNELYLLQSMTEPWVQLQIRCHGVKYNIGHPRLEGGAVLLHVAATYDLVDIIETLLESTDQIDARDYLGNTALHLAAQQGHIRASKILCEKGASCEAQNDYGMTALFGAARHGNLELFRWLLHKGAITGIDDDRDGALRAAAREGHTEVVQILLDAKIDVNAQDREYGNSLQAAARGRNVEVVKMLLDAHADVNAEAGEYGKALQAAACGGNVEVVNMLLDAHVEINCEAGECGKVLEAAAWSGNIEVVRILLDFYAGVDSKAREYRKALEIAVQGKQSEIVRLLLDFHATFDAQGREYGNSLQLAVSIGFSEGVQMLLDAHADVNSQGREFGNPLQAAAREGEVAMVQMLLDAYADVNAEGGEYGKALQAAAYNGDIEVMQMLLDNHADVNAESGKYGNALQAAVHNGHIEVVQMLLHAHADVNAQGGQYGNALQAAVYNGHIEIVRTLLNARANVNAQGGRYDNALQAAVCKGHVEVVRMLLDAHANVSALGAQYGNALQAATLEGQTDIMCVLLDARGDVNFHGGKYQSSVKAAHSRDYPDGVRFSLDSEVYLPPLDGLDQNPLHIAVSRPPALSRLTSIISHCPYLTLALDQRDKLLRNPLHTSIYKGLGISSAIKLLELGSDPSILDGYGRNIVDWVQGNRYLMAQIRPHCPQTLPTCQETQYLTTRQSVLLFAKNILRSLPDFQLPLVQQLGHFLLHLNDEDRATYLFQLHLSPETQIFRIECFICDEWIYGLIFVCRQCPNVVLCWRCIRCQPPGLLHTYFHEKFEISALRDKEQFFRSSSDTLGLFLQDLIEEFSAKSADDPKKGFLDYPSLSAAQEETAFSLPKTTFGPAIIACTILVVILGVSIGCFYF